MIYLIVGYVCQCVGVQMWMSVSPFVFLRLVGSLCFCYFAVLQGAALNLARHSVQTGCVSFWWEKMKEFSLMSYIRHSNSVLTKAKESHINNSFCVCLCLLVLCESHSQSPFLPLYLFHFNAFNRYAIVF